MRRPVITACLTLLGLVMLALPAVPQTDGTTAPAEPVVQPAPPAPPSPLAENVQIGLSTNRISITSDFAGADLTIFGAIDGIDPQLARMGRYDIIVVLQGPSRPLVVRRKSRVLGVWMNTESETFLNVPASYSIATTRAFQDITVPASYRQLSLGTEHLFLAAADTDSAQPTLVEFRAALRDRKRDAGLYTERVGGVRFLSQNLFRATVSLAPNVPLGTHRARAFLFRNGVFVGESSTSLGIYKAGFEQGLYDAAHQHGFLYGLFAVVLAAITGWLGSIVFRRD